MRKNYIRPEIEVVASQYEQEIMAGHSYDWADAKGSQDWLGEDEEEVIQNKNLWDD